MFNNHVGKERGERGMDHRIIIVVLIINIV